MPALLPRLAAASVGATVALAVLGAPTAALAAGPGDAPGAARAAQQGPAALPTQAADASNEATSPTATGSTATAPTATGSAGGAAAGRSTAAAAASRTEASEPRRATKPARAAKPVAKPARAAKPAKPAARPPKPAKAAKAEKPAKPAAAVKVKDATGKSAESAKDGGDPRGNNGTFKVDGPVLDTSHGNEPQVDCAFRLNFYGYDAGQLANIVFMPIAPTPGAATTVSGRQLISTDAAKGGLYNGSYPVTGTWTAADLGLDPTVKQHVKVSVESLNADGSDVPGGAKHKVFWLHPCGAAPVAVTTAAAPQAPAFGPRSISAAPPAQPAVAPAAAPVMGPQAQVLGAALTAVTAQSVAPVTVVTPAGVGTAPARTVGAATVAVPQVTRPAALPFTGSPQLVALLVGGLVALLGGAGLVAAARTGA